MYQNGDYSGFSGNNYASWRPYLNYTFDGTHGFSLNVSIPAVQGSIRTVREDQFVIGGTQGTNNENGVTQGHLWALNLDPTKGAMGSLLWNITFTPPSSAGNKTISMGTGRSRRRRIHVCVHTNKNTLGLRSSDWTTTMAK